MDEYAVMIRRIQEVFHCSRELAEKIFQTMQFDNHLKKILNMRE